MSPPAILPFRGAPGNGLTIKQASSGYRYSLDALAVADFANLNPGDRVVDLGAGCGVISLVLAARFPDARIYGVELLAEQVDIGRQNIIDNNLTGRVTLLHQDIRTLAPAQTCGPVDVVIANPPHIKKNAGRINPDPRIAIARHEIRVTLEDIIAAARRMLRPLGRLIMVYPAARLTDLIAGMRQAEVEPRLLTLVYTRPDVPARRVLIEGVKGGGPGLTINPSMVVRS